MRNRLLRLIKKEGSFLLESMIGTAILAIVMTFFGTVTASAFIMIQKAYHETKAMEEVFQKIESHSYSDLTLTRSTVPLSQTLILKTQQLDTATYSMVKYKDIDDREGILTGVSALSQSADLHQGDLYTYKYEKDVNGYSAVFYIIKGEK